MAKRRMQAARVRLRIFRSKDVGSVCAIVGDGVHSWMGDFFLGLI